MAARKFWSLGIPRNTYNKHGQVVDDNEHCVFKQLSAAAAGLLGRQQTELTRGSFQLVQVCASAFRFAATVLLRRWAGAVSEIKFSNNQYNI